MTHSLLTLRSAGASGSRASFASGFLFAIHPEAVPALSPVVVHSLAIVIPGGR